MIESFKSMPTLAKILLILGVGIIVLAVVAPLIKILVDLVIGAVILALVLGGGYFALVKLGILK